MSHFETNRGIRGTGLRNFVKAIFHRHGDTFTAGLGMSPLAVHSGQADRDNPGDGKLLFRSEHPPTPPILSIGIPDILFIVNQTTANAGITSGLRPSGLSQDHLSGFRRLTTAEAQSPRLGQALIALSGFDRLRSIGTIHAISSVTGLTALPSLWPVGMSTKATLWAIRAGKSMWKDQAKRHFRRNQRPVPQLRAVPRNTENDQEPEKCAHSTCVAHALVASHRPRQRLSLRKKICEFFGSLIALNITHESLAHFF